jgi:hypothetical protein
MAVSLREGDFRYPCAYSLGCFSYATQKGFVQGFRSKERVVPVFFRKTTGCLQNGFTRYLQEVSGILAWASSAAKDPHTGPVSGKWQEITTSGGRDHEAENGSVCVQR